MEETVVKAVKTMCDRLANYHWSPAHPSTYVLPVGNGTFKGVGIIASKNYGAFNLAWASCYGKWETDADQMHLVGAFTRYQGYTSEQINGVPLGDWLCLLRPRAFMTLLDSAKLPVHMSADIVLATSKALSMELP